MRPGACRTGRARNDQRQAHELYERAMLPALQCKAGLGLAPIERMARYGGSERSGQHIRHSWASAPERAADDL